MRFKTWPVAALGLGSLLVLIVVSMLASSRKAQEIYTELDQLNTYHHNLDAKLRRLRSDVHLSGIFVRDYLLDVERERGPEYRERLAEFRRDQHGDASRSSARSPRETRSGFAACRRSSTTTGRRSIRSSTGRRRRRSSAAPAFCGARWCRGAKRS